MMRSTFYLICFSLVWATACGPDLDPQKYLVKSIQLKSFEEYYFQYAGNRLESIFGTDSVLLRYAYYKDSTSILHTNKSGKLFQRTRLEYLGSLLTKVKVDWTFSKIWYKDSIQFSYNGNTLETITYKNQVNQVIMQNGNLASISRGSGLLSVSYNFTYDQVTNPLRSVYWLDPFILPSGSTTLAQPNIIARYFSKNNLSTATDVILKTTAISRYSYTYLHGILPKTINLEVETAKSKISDLVYIFDIQYLPIATSSSP
jgi:hypothetical protein